MRWMLLAIAAWGGMATAAVKELRPDQLAAFVAAHEYAVVQMTSPDPGCGYCKGADKLFDQAAALPHKRALAFGRVQWTPWRQIPDFGGVIEVGWVPQQPVFLNGKLLGRVDGQQKSAAGLLAKIDEVIADPPVARLAREAPAKPAKPLSDTEKGAVRLGIRRDFLNSLSRACGGRFAERAANYQHAVQAWRGANEVRLKQADLLLVSRSGGDAKAMAGLVDEEQQTLQTWQAGQLGIPMGKAPQVADCDKIFASLTSLPQ